MQKEQVTLEALALEADFIGVHLMVSLLYTFSSKAEEEMLWEAFRALVHSS